MFFVLILRLFASDHHGASVGDGLHGRDVFGIGGFTLMFVFDVGVKGGVAEIGFSTGADVISLCGLIPCPAFPFILLDDGDVVAFVVGLLLVH